MLKDDKIQPNDKDTEEAVLATLMRYNEKFSLYADILDENLFYWSANKIIFLGIKGVIEQGKITDINSIYEYYLTEGLSRINHNQPFDKIDIVNVFKKSNTPTLEQDIKRLKNYSLRRKAWEVLVRASDKMLTLTEDADVNIANLCDMLGDLRSEEDTGVYSFGDALDNLTEIISDNAQGKHIRLNTGFSLFDDYYLLRPDTMTIIAAFTSVGKSALSMNIAVNVARRGDAVAYYSLEMGKAELASRGISRDAGLPASVLMNKKLDEIQLRNYDAASGFNKHLPIYIDERSTVSFDKTVASIRTLAKTKNIKLAIIDYLQIYSQTTDNTESSLAYMARAAKNVAKECGIAVIVLSQLNRSGTHPNIKMLRGSGQIEESADNIVLIDRPAAYPGGEKMKYEGEYEDKPTEGTAKLMLVKGRGVGTGCSLVGFEGKYTRFYELTENSQTNEETPF